MAAYGDEYHHQSVIEPQLGRRDEFFCHPYLWALDGRQRITSKLVINVSSGKIVHNHNVMTLITQV